MNRIKPATLQQQYAAENALAYLRKARRWLVYADCPQTVDKLRSTIKSTEGAIRHIQRRVRATGAQP